MASSFLWDALRASFDIGVPFVVSEDLYRAAVSNPKLAQFLSNLALKSNGPRSTASILSNEIKSLRARNGERLVQKQKHANGRVCYVFEKALNGRTVEDKEPKAKLIQSGPDFDAERIVNALSSQGVTMDAISKRQVDILTKLGVLEGQMDQLIGLMTAPAKEVVKS